MYDPLERAELGERAWDQVDRPAVIRIEYSEEMGQNKYRQRGETLLRSRACRFPGSFRTQ